MSPCREKKTEQTPDRNFGKLFFPGLPSLGLRKEIGHEREEKSDALRLFMKNRFSETMNFKTFWGGSRSNRKIVNSLLG